MVNFLGQMPDENRLLAIEGLSYHTYGKAARPGRKLGHCTILRTAATARNRVLSEALQLITWS
jgi:5-(carboxyamino)imidazole ribonucleotide synthase